MVEKKQQSILQEAEDIINGPRREDYGGPLESFTRIGKLWAPILHLPYVTPEQVVLKGAERLRLTHHLNDKLMPWPHMKC